jgi:cephalosporin-C deacetylase-like acetyl esterase
MAVDLRRAVDLMLSRSDVDKSRIAYVGHSYGAMLGGILTAVEKRIKTFVLLGGLARTTHHIRTSPWWQRFRSSVPAEKLEDYQMVRKQPRLSRPGRDSRPYEVAAR